MYVELVTIRHDGRRYGLGVREGGRRDYLVPALSGGGLRRTDLLRPEIVEALEDALEESRDEEPVRFVELEGERLRVYRLAAAKGETISVVVSNWGRSAIGPNTFMVLALSSGGNRYPIAQATTPEQALKNAAEWVATRSPFEFNAKGRI